MRKEGITVLLVVLALTLASCASQTPSTPVSSTPFIGGTVGLSAKFATNSPPAEVTDRDTAAGAPTNTFDIIVLLENIGESKVPKGSAAVTISGISATDFSSPVKSLKGNNKDDELSEVKKDTEGNKIPGSLTDVRFENLAFQSTLQGNAVFPVQADVCYPYTTKVVTDMCIRADATKATSGVCQIAGQKTVFNSGAPIQVSSVKENVGGRNKVLLTFNVKTVGAGSFFKPASGCPKGTFSAENVVKVDVTTGISGITCSGLSGGAATSTGYGGLLRIDNGAGTFSCIQATPAEDSIKKVNVVLSYDHLISISTNLLVKHLPSDTPYVPPVVSSTPGAPTITFGQVSAIVVSPTAVQFPLPVTATSSSTSNIASLTLTPPSGTSWAISSQPTSCPASTTCAISFVVTVPAGTSAGTYTLKAKATTADGKSAEAQQPVQVGSAAQSTQPLSVLAGVYFVPTANQAVYTDLKNNCKLNGAVFDDTSVSGTARCYCPTGSRWVSPAPSDASKISLPDIARGCVGVARLAELKVPNAGIVGGNAYVQKFATGTTTISTYYTNLQTICEWVNKGAFTDTAADESGQILGKCPCPTGKTWANANDVTQLCT